MFTTASMTRTVSPTAALEMMRYAVPAVEVLVVNGRDVREWKQEALRARIGESSARRVREEFRPERMLAAYRETGGYSALAKAGTSHAATDAASTIPFDSMPISFAGLRFATSTIRRPTSAAGS